MATVTLGNNFSFTNDAELDLENVLSVSATEIQLSNNAGRTAQLRGAGFTFDGTGEITGGVFTSVAFQFLGQLELSVENMSVEATSTTFETGYGGEPPGMQGEFAYWLRGDDVITAAAGNETLKGYGGNDAMDGGAGLDTAAYLGNHTSFQISRNATTGGFTVVDTIGGSGTDALFNIERLAFADKHVALDVDSGTAGQAYRMYRAAFARTPDEPGVGFWIARMDGGVTLQQMADGFQASPEFLALYGGSNPSNVVFLTKLYSNVLGRNYDQAGFDWWLNQLNTVESVSQTVVLVHFSESVENRAAVAEVIGNGFAYDPWTPA